MTNLVQCTRCNKKLLNEEYDTHKCMPAIKKMVTLKFACSYENKDEHGRKIIGIRTLDGMDYEFIEIPEDKEHTKIPYQPIVNTNNNSREDNSSARG